MGATERVEWLARGVMEWQKEVDDEDGYPWWVDKNGRMTDCMTWNPLTDWNHWRQVEQEVMEDEDLWNAYWDFMDEVMNRSPDLVERARCLWLAYQSLR